MERRGPMRLPQLGSSFLNFFPSLHWHASPWPSNLVALLLGGPEYESIQVSEMDWLRHISADLGLDKVCRALRKHYDPVRLPCPPCSSSRKFQQRWATSAMRLLAFIWGQLVGFARAAGTDTNCVTSFSLSCESTLDNLTTFACVKLRSDCNAIPRERGWPLTSKALMASSTSLLQPSVLAMDRTLAISISKPGSLPMYVRSLAVQTVFKTTESGRPVFVDGALELLARQHDAHAPSLVE